MYKGADMEYSSKRWGGSPSSRVIKTWIKYHGGWLNLLFHQATVTKLSARDVNVLKCCSNCWKNILVCNVSIAHSLRQIGFQLFLLSVHSDLWPLTPDPWHQRGCFLLSSAAHQTRSPSATKHPHSTYLAWLQSPFFTTLASPRLNAQPACDWPSSRLC